MSLSTLKFLAFAVAAVALHTGCSIDAQIMPATGTFNRTLQVNGSVDLSVRTGSGRITIATGPEESVVVAGRIRARNSAFSELDAAERVKRLEASPPVTQDGNRIEVGEIQDRTLGHNLSIDYDITVPTRTKIRTRTGSGDQAIGGVLGPVEVSAGSGDLRVGPIGSAATVSTGSGDIELLGARGDVSVNAGSGNVRAAGLNGGVHVRTGSGDIDIDSRPTDDWTVTAGSGDVTLTLPGDAAFVLDATTSSGSLRSRHELAARQSSRRHLEGVAQGGGPRLAVSTGSGSIRVD